MANRGRYLFIGFLSATLLVALAAWLWGRAALEGEQGERLANLDMVINEEPLHPFFKMQGARFMGSENPDIREDEGKWKHTIASDFKVLNDNGEDYARAAGLWVTHTFLGNTPAGYTVSLPDSYSAYKVDTGTSPYVEKILGIWPGSFAKTFSAIESNLLGCSISRGCKSSQSELIQLYVKRDECRWKASDILACGVEGEQYEVAVRKLSATKSLFTITASKQSPLYLF